MIIILGTAQPVSAEDMDENSLYVIELINEIRLDPLGYAQELGFNREDLLITLPWIEEFAGGIDPLIFSDFLNKKADFLNTDDPLAVKPVPTLDTDFAGTGDIGGVVSFVNFMDPEAGIEVVIDNQFTKELDPLYEGERYILSREYNYAGASFSGVNTLLNAQPGYAYSVSACFGSSQLRSEVQVVNMINQMRAKTITFNEYLAAATAFLPGNYQPLFFNDSLQSTARLGVTSEIDFPWSAELFGFTGSGVIESSVIENFPKSGLDMHALWIFYSLILNEVKSYPVENTIFNPLYNETGAAVYSVNSEDNDFIKLTLATGIIEKQDSDVSKIYGVLFTDIDGNGAYTPGEGAAERSVAVYDMATLLKIAAVTTNNAGQFSISLPNNANYSIQTGSEENWAGKIITLTSDLFFDLVVQ